MPIVCGTDFSDHSAHAADAAAALALRWKVPLHLAHAMGPSTGEVDREATLAALSREAERLRAGGVDVRVELLTGHAGEALARHAEKTGARLIVLAALGERAASGWLLGGNAERAVVLAKAPVLVVRKPDAITGWARGQGPLRLALGIDFTPPSDAAWRWVRDLSRIGPCQVSLIHVCWSPGEHDRLRIQGPLGLVGLHPDVARTLERDVRARFEAAAGEPEPRLILRGCLGRPADHLTQIASEEQADLLVVGTHQRTGLSKLWHGSVSHDVLRFARTSVVCVPTAGATGAPAIPEVRSVLATTDLSELGNRAIPWAYALLGKGGTVHLLHVVDDPARQAEVPTRLRELIPESATARGIESQIHVRVDSQVARTISQEAERLGVDAVCIASHGRSGLSEALLGSVAHALLGQSRRPVFVVRMAE